MESEQTLQAVTNIDKRFSKTVTQVRVIAQRLRELEVDPILRTGIGAS